MKFLRQKLIGLSLIAITVFPACLSQQEGAQTGLIEPPPDPSGLSGTANSTSQITLNWSSGGGTTTQYRASYQAGSTAPADCASGTTISEGTLGAGTSIAIGSLSGSVWSFRVCAINANPTPDVSDGSTVTTYLLPPNVTSLSAGSPSVTQISLSWTSGGGSTSGYRIKYQAGATAPADCSSPQVSEGSITGTSHTIGSLTAGNQYSFRVCAINPNSDVASGTTVSGSVYLDATWTARRRLTFDNSTVAENLTNVPVLVTLNSTRIDYANVQNAGEDLRFVDADGTQLDFQIEEWNEAGTSYVWVKVPQIDSSSSTDYIWMYYGNGAAADGQNQASAWGNNYQAVLHMEDTTPNDTLGVNNGTGNGSVSATTGKISNGLSFTGALLTDYISIPDNASLNFATNATIELWFRLTSTFDSSSTTTLNLINKRSSDSDVMFMALTGTDYTRGESPDGALVFKVENSNQRIFKWTSQTTWNAGTWYYVAATLNTTTNQSSAIYVNGADATAGSDLLEGTDGNNLNFSANWGIGGQDVDSGNFSNLSGGGGPTASVRYFDGLMDEVRISQIARSSGWIRAQNLSMTDAYISFGSEETP
ncbi:MAG: DUF2341 domain-containing protein [Bdellovibrionota bacterium]